MRLRAATPLDVPTMGEIQADCNQTDTISRYFIRNVDKYPTTYRRGSVRFVKRRIALPGAVPFVVETESSDYPKTGDHSRAPEVVGFVIFQRIGSSEKAQEWQGKNQSWWASVNGFLDSLEDRYLQFFPSVQCTFQHQFFRQILPYLTIPFDEEVFAEAWEIDLFFVDPRWQRRGLGKKLLRWVFDRATEEKVPVIVKSSSIGVAAYRAYGFRSLGEVGLNKLLNTTEFGGEEPQLLVWEPEACQGMWFDKGKEALDKQLEERATAGQDAP